MKKVLAGLVVLFVLGLTVHSFAQELKVGYIDISRTFDEYTRTKEADAVLEKKGLDKEAQREKMVNEIKKLKEELDLVADKVKSEKQKSLEDKLKVLQEYDRAAREDLGKERDNIVKEILKEIDEIIQEFGKKEGYTFIFNDRVLLYKDKTKELTDSIISMLNSRYQKKSKP
ncbi:MAG: OmpH family outer membrane protein [Candidatus Omnitrophica bacterium]|nr:OmpH family outer membrane protein [Candidatus Omnitrophota bacterium]